MERTKEQKYMAMKILGTMVYGKKMLKNITRET